MTTELQRLALGLADHVKQAGESCDGELADGLRASISTGKAAISIGVARPARISAATSSRLFEQAGIGLVEQSGESGAAGVTLQVEHHRSLGGVEELEQRRRALRQKRRRSADRIAAWRLDLEHVGTEVGGDLAGQRIGQPQRQRHARGR